MFCWPHHSKQEFLDTHYYLQHKIAKRPFSGYIGFSNGGFFLLTLAQIESINVPIIAIGAGGSLKVSEKSNRIFLLIGNQDKLHYQYAKQFYQQAQNTPLDVTLIEYNGGHAIPKKPLEKLIKEINGNRPTT